VYSQRKGGGCARVVVVAFATEGRVGINIGHERTTSRMMYHKNRPFCSAKLLSAPYTSPMVIAHTTVVHTTAATGQTHTHAHTHTRKHTHTYQHSMRTRRDGCTAQAGKGNGQCGAEEPALARGADGLPAGARP
jgi:hypothetical protein